MIYLDLGCHDGTTILDFLEGSFGEYDFSKIKIVGVEATPEPFFTQEWTDIRKQYKNVDFIREAAWTHDGEIVFSQRDKTISSSVMADKNNFGIGELKKIPCFDFSSYVLSLNDDVLVRMNIEGAEYPILEQMIKTGAISKVKQLNVETHAHKMNDYWKKKHNEIFDELDKLGIKYKTV